MKLFACKLLTDENIHPSVVSFLRQQSCDVEDVSTLGLTGDADEVILRAALNHERIVVTHDRDFGRLAILSRQPIHGIMFLRPGHIDPQFTIEPYRQSTHESLTFPQHAYLSRVVEELTCNYACAAGNQHSNLEIVLKEKKMKYKLALALLSLTLGGCSESKVTTTDAAKTEAKPVAFNTANAPTVQFEVPDMMCEEGCAATVKEVLISQPGAVDVKVEFDKKLATVAIDEKFDQDAAVAALLDKLFPNTKLFTAPEKPTEPTAPSAPAEPEPKG